jgi:transcriptional regulator with XRE-family HTH domain
VTFNSSAAAQMPLIRRPRFAFFQFMIRFIVSYFETVSSIEFDKYFWDNSRVTVRPKTNERRMLSEIDRKIGLRLAFIRHLDNRNQEDMARELSLSKNQLSFIESGRVPLKLKNGWNACKQIGISPRWLLQGGDEKQYFPTLEEDFSAWIETVIEANKNSSFSEGFRPLVNIIFDDSKEGEAYRERVLKLKPLPKFPVSRSRDKALIDKPLPFGDAADVPIITTLPELIAVLQKLTKVRGLKADLAEHCQVTRQAVDQWLRQDAKPAAEAVFAALDWVRKQSKAKE